MAATALLYRDPGVPERDRIPSFVVVVVSSVVVVVILFSGHQHKCYIREY